MHGIAVVKILATENFDGHSKWFPGFKPFTMLRSLGRQSERLGNNYISSVSTVRRIRQQLWFNHRCKDQGIVPAGLKLKSPLNTQEADQIVKSTCRRLVKAPINKCHRRLNYCNNKLQQQLDKLKQLLPTNLLDTVTTIADRRADKTTDRVRTEQERKLTRLQRKKIGPQCVLGVLCIVLFLSVRMLFSNASIWELNCHK